MGYESSRVLTRSAQADVQMSDVQKVQVTEIFKASGLATVGRCSSNERGDSDPTTLGVWKATRAATLEWGGCTPAHLFACRHACVHMQTCSHGREKCPNWGRWVGARRLEGGRLGPISCGMPRRGGVFGDTWELGPRRYPFVLVRCLSVCLSVYSLGSTRHV